MELSFKRGSKALVFSLQWIFVLLKLQLLTTPAT